MNTQYLVTVGLFIVLVWYVISGPSRIKNIIQRIRIFFMYEIFEVLDVIIKQVIKYAYIIGCIAAVLIFFGALTIMVDNIMKVLDPGTYTFDRDGMILILNEVSKMETTWIVIPIILAATVAFGNFRTLDFNFIKYEDEKKEKRKNEVLKKEDY